MNVAARRFKDAFYALICNCFIMFSFVTIIIASIVLLHPVKLGQGASINHVDIQEEVGKELIK